MNIVCAESVYRAREAFALNARGDYAAAEDKMRLNREEMRQIRAGYDDQILRAPAAAAALAIEETWNASAESAVGGALAPKASKSLGTRAYQVEFQQNTSQDGL